MQNDSSTASNFATSTKLFSPRLEELEISLSNTDLSRFVGALQGKDDCLPAAFNSSETCHGFPLLCNPNQQFPPIPGPFAPFPKPFVPPGKFGPNDKIEFGYNFGYKERQVANEAQLRRAKSMFVLPKDVAVGNIMTVLPEAQQFVYPPHLLPRSIVDILVPGIGMVRQLFKAFGIDVGSQVEEDFTNEIDSKCFSDDKLQGEERACLMSISALEEFVVHVLGAEGINIIGVSDFSSGTLIEGAYTVKDIVDAPCAKSSPNVACHLLPQPFGMFYCHALRNTTIYNVLLSKRVDGIETGTDLVNTRLTCHYNTTDFPSNHIGFDVTGSKPGLGGLCHWSESFSLAFCKGNATESTTVQK